MGASYADLLAVARTAEECGFDAFFRSEHYLAFPDGIMGGRAMGSGAGLPGPTDAWITLAGLARDTTRIRLGTLVSPVTFRPPAALAISVAQVDAMSGGRVELGIGTGWFEAEHYAYGIPFPPLGERFELLEEQLEIITGLWTSPIDKSFSFQGRHYQLTDAPALPKPLQQPRPPIVIGGGGVRRTPQLAALYADDFNVGYIPIQEVADRFARGRTACEAVGRDPATLVYSTAMAVCCANDAVTLRRRAAAINRDVDRLRQRALCGSADEILTRLAEYHAIGTQRVYLQLLDLSDLDHIHEIAQVLPGASQLT
jgi:F420-dependent oxidoreductase-like protein